MHGDCEGYRIPAGREVALAIERQTGFTADSTMSTCDPTISTWRGRARPLLRGGGVPVLTGSPPLPFRTVEVHIGGIPFSKEPVRSIDVVHEHREHLNGGEPAVLADLADLIAAIDPHVVLFPHADLWLPRILFAAEQRGIVLPFSRSGRYRKISEKSVLEPREDRVPGRIPIPDGRILIDTAQSFHYRESGLAGIILGARLTGLAPNLTARFTSGT